MFSAVWSFISSKIPLKVWLAIFSVLIALGAFLWFKHSIYQECKSDEQAKDLAAKNTALELALTESQQYAAFLLNAQRKNDNFVNKQKKDLFDAKDADGVVAPVLRNTFIRMWNARKDDEKR